MAPLMATITEQPFQQDHVHQLETNLIEPQQACDNVHSTTRTSALLARSGLHVSREGHNRHSVTLTSPPQNKTGRRGGGEAGLPRNPPSAEVARAQGATRDERGADRNTCPPPLAPAEVPPTNDEGQKPTPVLVMRTHRDRRTRFV